MSKATSSLFFIVLLFCFTLSCASRPEPAFHEATPNKIDQHKDVVNSKQVAKEESCNGGQDEECLERRNLAAHLDYIYTQNLNP
ncbi:phytosulfokine 3-like [Capsicum galapagoense]